MAGLIHKEIIMKYNNVVEYNPINLEIEEKPKYFIVGRCLSGSRHYSESICFCDLFEMINKYIAVVDYFGGGTVEVYYQNGDVFYSTTVMNFDF